MKIEEFIKEYNASVNKEECVKKHIIDKYVPYERKIALCKNVVDCTLYNNGKFQINTPMKTVFFSLTLIMTYTDIEVSLGKNSMNSFNLLDAEDLFDLFFTKISPSELKKMNSILNMMIDDTYENERNIIDYFDRKITAMQMMVDMATKSIEEVTSESTTTPKNKKTTRNNSKTI